VKRIPAFGPGKLSSVIFFIAVLLCLIKRSHSVDIVQASQLGVPAFSAVLYKTFFKKAVVLKSEGSDLEYAAVGLWRRPVTRLILQIADAFVAISKNHVDLYRGLNLPEEKLVFIPNGVEVPLDTELGKHTSERFGLPPGKINFTFTGRLEPVKGLEVLLRAWGKLPENVLKNSNLVIAGTGSLKNSLQSAARNEKMDNVFFTGKIDDVTALLRISTVFLNTSFYEGTSLSILEAMASGLAIIASDAGGNRELISHGESGLLFAAGDEDELAGCICKFFHDPVLLSRCGEGAAQVFQEKYDFAKISLKYLELYSRLGDYSRRWQKS
jgi:glycosyltransferase involved in cell wall biosynthesis